MQKSIFDMPVISAYSQEQAIEDGVLVKVGYYGKCPIIFTSNLFYDGFEDKEVRTALVNKGLKMLRQAVPEDTKYMRLRVIEKDKIWIIFDGSALTFLKPEDY
ncbi:MAG: hypothetical protein A2252_00115 [Elusimicrobia bacterium RIFOXYA2_FULL_39_19]|nr:MAG: hypothetical protein A2252_00115 [Elusimicrobia bacterium RIFOXYA2_FULL_39_19]